MQNCNNTTNEEEVRESIFRDDFEEWCKNEGMSTQRNPSGTYTAVESHWRLYLYMQKQIDALWNDYADLYNA